MINAGELDKRITIRRPTKTVNNFGEEVVAYIDVTTVWGKLKFLRGGERYAAKQINASIEAEFIMRYRPDVTVEDVLVCDGKEYDIAAILPIGKNEGLQITAGGKG